MRLGSIVVPLQTIALHKQSKFLRVTLLSMVGLLVGNIFAHLRTPRMRNRKSAISPPPSEFARHQAALVYPMRRTALEEVHRLLNAEAGRQIDQNMNMAALD